jgi:hypothetical protein
VTTNLTVSVSGSADDNTGVSRVRYYSDTGGSGTAAGTESWSAMYLPVYSGDNVFTFTAVDAAGNTGTDTITIHVPYLTVTNPTIGQITLAWGPVGLNEDGSTLTDLAGYRLYYGISSRVYDDSYDVGDTTTTTLSDVGDGLTYFFAVTAYSTAGRESAYSTEATWLSADITPPTLSCPDSVTITANLSGTASLPDLRAQATASDNSSASADIQITQSPAPGSSISIGTTVTTLTALDEAGNSSDCTIDIIVTAAPPPPDETAPTVSIVLPTTEALYVTTDMAISLSGTAADNEGVVRVSYSGSGRSGTCSGTENWSVSALPLYVGDNVFTITAMDSAGNADSDVINVRLSTSFMITKPTAGTTAAAGGPLLVEWRGFKVPGSLDIALRDSTNSETPLTNRMPVTAVDGSSSLPIPRSVKRGAYRVAAHDSGDPASATLSPSFTIVRNQRPSLRWDRVTGASGYRLWINKDGEKYYANMQAPSATVWTPWQELPEGLYEWWTRAYLPGEKQRKWIKQETFTIPYAEDPRRPMLDWDPVDNATWYELWINKGEEKHINIWLEQMRSTWMPESELTDGSYKWWTRAYVPGKERTKWVNQGTFTVPIDDNAVRPTFTWNTVKRAEWYRIELTLNDELFYDEWMKQTANTWTPETELPSGRYTWRVDAYISGDSSEGWVEMGSFELP